MSDDDRQMTAVERAHLPDGIPPGIVPMRDERTMRHHAGRLVSLGLRPSATTRHSRQQRGFDKQDLPDAELKLQLFTLALQRLCDAGYLYLGLDHFALPHDELSRAAQTSALRRTSWGTPRSAPSSS